MTYMKPQTNATEKARPPGAGVRDFLTPSTEALTLLQRCKPCPPASASDVLGTGARPCPKGRLIDLEPTARRAGWGPPACHCCRTDGQEIQSVLLIHRLCSHFEANLRGL